MITLPNTAWFPLEPLKMEPRYVSSAEFQRQERIAVGRICRCGNCVCCKELRDDSHPSHRR
jgi:hypothetical protein